MIDGTGKYAPMHHWNVFFVQILPPPPPQQSFTHPHGPGTRSEKSITFAFGHVAHLSEMLLYDNFVWYALKL
jgi:hypothetical protein